MTRGSSATLALCSALALAVASRQSAALEPTQASSARTVELVVVGTPSQQHWLEERLGPHSAAGATLVVGETDHFEPSDMLSATSDSSSTLRCWVDLREATRARIYFSARAGKRFLLRDLELSGSFDDLDRESLSQVLASSWSALFDDEQLGLSREETETLLEQSAAPTPPREATRARAPSPKSEPATPVTSASEASQAPSRAVRFRAFYAASACAKQLLLVQGPGLSLSAALHSRPRVALWLDGQYRFPETERDAHIGVRLESVATRAGLELTWPLDGEPDTGKRELGLRLGVGYDMTHLAPQPGSDGNATQLTSQRWTTELAITSGIIASTRLNQNAALGLRLFADVIPTLAIYDARVGTATDTLLSPWHVRPGIALQLETR